MRCSLMHVQHVGSPLVNPDAGMTCAQQRTWTQARWHCHVCCVGMYTQETAPPPAPLFTHWPSSLKPSPTWTHVMVHLASWQLTWRVICISLHCTPSPITGRDQCGVFMCLCRLTDEPARDSNARRGLLGPWCSIVSRQDTGEMFVCTFAHLP